MNIIQTEQMNIAKTILQQLGGNKFIAMTGAKNFSYNNIGLFFRLPNRKINHITISYDYNDTYTITARRIDIRKPGDCIVKEVNNIYCDQLQNVFTQITGLDTGGIK